MNEQKTRKWPQFLAAAIANIGALSIGTLLGWTSQASPKIAANETGVLMNEEELSWVAGAMPLGAAFTPFIVPFLIDSIGRKKTLLSVVPPFVGGFALLAWASNPAMYYAGRFICGLSGGAFSIVTPVYTGEIGEKSVRGALGTCYELMLAIGVEVSFVIGGIVSIFWLCIICGTIPIIFAIMFAAMPESPYFYTAKGKQQEAKDALLWLRGPNYDADEELKEIERTCGAQMNHKLCLADFKTRAAKKGIIIAFGLMFFQQFTGINAVVFNTTQIFQIAGSNLDPRSATMIVGLTFVVNFGSTMLVDRLGRRILLLTSGVVMAMCTAALGIFFYLLDNGYDVTGINWLPLASMCVFTIMFAVGWGPIAWMMLGELFSPQIKGVCGSTACCINWFSAFLVSKFFPNLVTEFGSPAAFWVFSVISAVGVAFVFLLVPETKGKSLEEIQFILGKEPIRSKSSDN